MESIERFAQPSDLADASPALNLTARGEKVCCIRRAMHPRSHPTRLPRWDPGLAALLLAQILPVILGRRACIGAPRPSRWTPDFHHGLSTSRENTAADDPRSNKSPRSNPSRDMAICPAVATAKMTPAERRKSAERRPGGDSSAGRSTAFDFFILSSGHRRHRQVLRAHAPGYRVHPHRGAGDAAARAIIFGIMADHPGAPAAADNQRDLYAIISVLSASRRAIRSSCSCGCCSASAWAANWGVARRSPLNRHHRALRGLFVGAAPEGYALGASSPRWPTGCCIHPSSRCTRATAGA